jgi:hypothetical protein
VALADDNGKRELMTLADVIHTAASVYGITDLAVLDHKMEPTMKDQAKSGCDAFVHNHKVISVAAAI